MKKILYLSLISLFISVSVYAQIDRSKQPIAGPSPSIHLGKTSNFKMNNGLQVFVVENHKLPRVMFSLTLDNPPSLEGELKGINSLTGSLMGNGTSKISKDDYNEQLDFYGAPVWFGVDHVGANTLSKYFPQVLSLVAKGALDPIFDESDFSSEKAKLLDGLKVNEKNTKYIAGRVRRVLLYGKNHPSGEYITEKTVNQVTLQDVKDYYKQNFIPNNAYLVIVGDVKFDEVKRLVEQNFASWKNTELPKSTYVEPQNVKQTEIDFVNVPNAVQSEISVANTVRLKMTDKDYFAALLANDILGGGAESYLFMNLREAHGWTYGAYSSIGGSKYVSDFKAGTAVRNAVTDSAVVAMMSEIKRIRTTLPTKDVLYLAKAKYIGNFVMESEKPETIARFALQEKTQTLPPNFFEDYIKNLNAVTLEEVQAAAKKYFLEDQARIVIAGKQDDVLSKLVQLGLPLNQVDKYGDDIDK